MDYLLRRGLESDLFSGANGRLLSGGSIQAQFYTTPMIGLSIGLFHCYTRGVDADESPLLVVLLIYTIVPTTFYDWRVETL